MTSRPTILVDNNALSHLELGDRVRRKTIYLADAVLLELFGAGNWELSIAHALAPLAPFADHIVGATAMSVLLADELTTGIPTKSIAGDPVVTARLPDLLRGCRDTPQRAIEYFRADQHLVSLERVKRIADISGYRELSLDVIGRIRARFDRSELARVITQPERTADLFAELNMWPDAIEGLRQIPILGKLDCPKWEPLQMASVPCCWMRMF